MVTAAHVVYSDVYGWSKRVFFYAAKNGSSKPYGEAYSISNTISSAWSQNGNNDYDWSVITLNTNVGSSTGYLGKYRTSGSLVGTSVTTAGYPSLSTNAGYMQKSTGSVVSQTDYKVYSSYNVYNGLSGAPIYKDNGIAIGITTGYSYSESNALGVRFTKHVYDMLQEKLEESLEKYN